MPSWWVHLRQSYDLWTLANFSLEIFDVVFSSIWLHRLYMTTELGNFGFTILGHWVVSRRSFHWLERRISISMDASRATTLLQGCSMKGYSIYARRWDLSSETLWLFMWTYTPSSMIWLWTPPDTVNWSRSLDRQPFTLNGEGFLKSLSRLFLQVSRAH